MKHLEFYTKYKTKEPLLVNPVFSRKNWWYVVLMAVVAVLTEPLIMYGQRRFFSFSFDDYLELIEYMSLIMIPFVGFLFWVNWRETLKKGRGYGWVGTFEVIGKRSTFFSSYLALSPGDRHEVSVDRKFYSKVHVGDFIQIRRNALGGLESIGKTSSFSRLLSKARTRRTG